MGVSEPVNPNLERMYNEGIEKKNKLARALKEKERLEMEEAVAMSQMPKTKTSHVGKNGKAIVNSRTLEQFMEDQIRFEHRRYENLKNAIIKEEAQEESSFHPQINQKSVTILKKRGSMVGLPHSSSELLTDSLGEMRK